MSPPNSLSPSGVVCATLDGLSSPSSWLRRFMVLSSWSMAPSPDASTRGANFASCLLSSSTWVATHSLTWVSVTFLARARCTSFLAPDLSISMARPTSA